MRQLTSPILWVIASLFALTLAQSTPSVACKPAQLIQAFSAAPISATSYCNAFTKTTSHSAWPSFLFKGCKAQTGSVVSINQAISTACSSYMVKPRTSSSKSAQSATTKHSTTTPKPASARTTSSLKTSSKPITISSRTPIRTSSSTKATASKKSSSLTPETKKSSSTSMLPAAPTAKLIPVLDPYNNGNDIKNLIPQDSSALYYAENSYKTNPYLVKLYAQMDVNFTYPTVLVENSEFLVDLSCSSTSTSSLGFKITSVLAYSIIKSTWTAEDMVLIFNGDDCQHTLNDTRSYWLGHVGSVTWNYLTMTGNLRFVGDEILVQQGIKNAALVWGSVGLPVGTSSSNVKLNNTALCRSTSKAASPSGLTSTNPCVADFDGDLDQKIGLQYTPSSDRQTGLNSLLINAYAHPNVVVPYVNGVAGNKKRKRQEHAPTPTMAGRLERRGILDPIESIGSGLLSGGSTAVSVITSVVSVASSGGTQATSDISSAISSGVRVISSVGNQVASGAQALATDLANGLEALSSQAVAAIRDFEVEAIEYSTNLGSVIANTAVEIADNISSWEPSGSGQLHINLAPSKLEDSPWGDAYVLFQYPSNKEKRSNTEKHVTAYCVNCGVQGVTDYHGSAKFSIDEGVEELTFAMNGTLQFGINIGLNAEIKYTMPELSFNLIPPQGAPILEIEGVIVVGPVLELKATLDGDITAEGKILAGATMTIPQFSTFFDFANTANSYVHGFENIQMQKYFAADGEIGATTVVGLPFSIGVGVALPAINFDKQIKLVNTPSITAQAQFEVELALGSGAPPPKDETTCPNGFNWAISFANTLALDFFGLAQTTLESYQPPPLAQACYKVPGLANNKILATPIATSKSKFTETTSKSKSTITPSKGKSTKTTSKAKPTTTTRSATSASAASTKGPFPAGKLPLYANSGMVSSQNVISNGSVVSYGTILHDTTGASSVISGADGNLYMQRTSGSTGSRFQRVIDTSASWTNDVTKSAYASSLTLVTDDKDRAFFLFPDTLGAFSASRIRLLDIDAVPKNAKQSVLGYGTLSNSSTLPATYFFADASSPVAAYYPVACTLVDAQSRTLTKLFAVSDLSAGIANLTSNTAAVQSILTGGTVKQCAFIALQGAYTPNQRPTDPLGVLAALAARFGLSGILSATQVHQSVESALQGVLAAVLAQLEKSIFKGLHFPGLPGFPGFH